jgi:hypothetical protein
MRLRVRAVVGTNATRTNTPSTYAAVCGDRAVGLLIDNAFTKCGR